MGFFSNPFKHDPIARKVSQHDPVHQAIFGGDRNSGGQKPGALATLAQRNGMNMGDHGPMPRDGQFPAVPSQFGGMPQTGGPGQMDQVPQMQTGGAFQPNSLAQSFINGGGMQPMGGFNASTGGGLQPQSAYRQAQGRGLLSMWQDGMRHPFYGWGNER